MAIDWGAKKMLDLHPEPGTSYSLSALSRWAPSENEVVHTPTHAKTLKEFMKQKADKHTKVMGLIHQ